MRVRQFPRGRQRVDMSENSQPIKALDSITSIRTRPAMFVGEMDHPLLINLLFREVLCIPFSNAHQGCATRVDMSVAQNGALAVWDNGPPPSLADRDGHPVMQRLLTQLFACRDTKDPIHKELCHFGIVVTNAFSSWFQVDCAIDSYVWRQFYKEGYPTGPFQRGEKTDETWERFSFHPDPSFFGDLSFDVAAFIQWYSDSGFRFSNCEVTLKDEATNRDFVLC